MWASSTLDASPTVVCSRRTASESPRTSERIDCAWVCDGHRACPEATRVLDRIET